MGISKLIIESLNKSSLEEKMKEIARDIFDYLITWDEDNYIGLDEIDSVFSDSRYSYELIDAIKEAYPIQDGEDEDDYSDRITEIEDENEIFNKTYNMVTDLLSENGWESEDNGYSKLYEYRGGYQELLDWLFDLTLTSDRISYTTSNSWAAGLLPSIYITFEIDYDEEYEDYTDSVELRVANHRNGNSYEYNYVYDNDDFKNWETKIKPDIEEWFKDMEEESKND